EPDVVDGAEDIGKIGQLQLNRIVGMDLDDTGRRFLNPVGNLTHRAHPALAKLVYLGLQLGDDVALHRIECDRDDAQERILHAHEEDDHQQLPTLDQWLVKRVADKTAQLLAFDGDHRDDLRRRGLLEVRRRKPQEPHVQQIAEAPQHSLAELPFERVDIVFETAVDKNECQEYSAQKHQVRHLVEVDAEECLREMLAINGAVDDRFRQFQRIIQEGERGEGEHQQHDLLAQAVLQDKAIDRGLEITAHRFLRLRRGGGVRMRRGAWKVAG